MLGENIKTYRQKKGYTQEEVANRLHVTRLTISKWEKNYSVPDAEVFVKLADVLEVQTSQLLEVKVDSDVQTTEEKQNAYAEQLAHIAEQMAIRNRQRKRIWKTIGIAFAVIIVVCIVLIVMNIAFFSAYPTTEDVQTHEETIMLEEQSYELLVCRDVAKFGIRKERVVQMIFHHLGGFFNIAIFIGVKNRLMFVINLRLNLSSLTVLI